MKSEHSPASDLDSQTAVLQSIISDLRLSVAWMDLVFAHLSECICVLSREDGIKFANDAFAKLTGQPRILLLGQPFWEIIQLTDTQGRLLNKKRLDEAWSSENEGKLAAHYKFKESVIELSGHYIPGIDQMIIVARDITESENTLQALQAKQRQLQEDEAKEAAMLNSIGDAVIASNKAGEMIFMNPSAEKLFCLRATDHVGERIVDFVPFHDEHGEIVPASDRPLSRALVTGLQEANEKAAYYLGRPDGYRPSISITITPVILENETVGAIGIYRDITRAREIDRMKTEFISLASHQLRTPLSSIRWFSEMLLTGDAGEMNESQTDYIQNISASAERMSLLIGSLLNISRIESGRIIIDPKPTDLKTLIHNVVSDVQPKITQRSQQLQVEIDDSIPKINIDPQLIGQVYLNLLTNAIKYTPEHGHITISVTQKDGQITSMVSDDGYGIPQTQQNRMFEKFFRATNILTIETDGTGLGLYLVKAIINSSGGKIWFKSDEGKGTTFWFSLSSSGMKPHAGEVSLDGPDNS